MISIIRSKKQEATYIRQTIRITGEISGKGKRAVFCLLNLEKVFERVSREAVQWAMRKLLVMQSLAQVVMVLYD